MKITVDEDRCQGHGLCYAEAPELFADDDIGHASPAVAGELDAEQAERAAAAARLCPELAISLGGHS